MFRVKKCCYALSLKTGTLMSFIWSLFVPIILQMLSNSTHTTKITIVKYLLLIPSLTYGFYGVYKKNGNLLRPYIVVTILLFTFDLFFSFIVLKHVEQFALEQSEDPRRDKDLEEPDDGTTYYIFFVFAILLLLAVLRFYCILVVYSYYKTLKERASRMRPRS